MTSLISEWKQDFKELWSNMRFEHLKNMRRKRLLIVVVTSISLALLFYLIPALSGNDFPDDCAAYISDLIGFVSLILILNAMFLGSDAINREHYSKTALLLYPLPQRRSIVIIAKYFTNLFTSWLSLAAYYAVVIITAIVIYDLDDIPDAIVRSFLFAMLYMSTLLAVGFALSALLDSPAASMAMTFFGFMILLPMVNMLLGSIDVDTDWIFTNYSGFISSVFRFPAEHMGPMSSSTGDLDFYEGIAYLLSYGFAGMATALGMGMRKEV